MAKLLANVYVPEVDEWFGPAYGNADTVPAEVAALIGDHCWDTPPDRGNGDPGAAVDGGQGDDGAAGGTAAPEPAPADQPVDLAALEGDELRAHAEQVGVTVDKRWGDDRLRTEIAAATEQPATDG